MSSIFHKICFLITISIKSVLFGISKLGKDQKKHLLFSKEAGLVDQVIVFLIGRFRFRNLNARQKPKDYISYRSGLHALMFWQNQTCQE